MAKAFVLVSLNFADLELYKQYSRENAPVECRKYVIDELKKSGICEIYAMHGEFDLMAVVDAKNFNDVGNTVLNKIRPIKYVLETKTFTVMPESF